MSHSKISVAKPTITSQGAERLILAASTHADKIQVPMAIAVCDASGELTAFKRMDGVARIACGIAQDKAYTASAFGLATHEWHDMIKDDPPLLDGIVHTPRLVIFGGGYPVKIDGQTIGAIGVSGGHYSQDMEVASAAISAVLDG